eukprot:gene44587-685_t
MFQAELRPARLLKQIIEALKEVVAEAVFECTEVGVVLNANKFQSFRCDR